jgi:hypothetical protein
MIISSHDLMFKIKKIFKAKLQCLLQIEKIFNTELDKKTIKYNM